MIPLLYYATGLSYGGLCIRQCMQCVGRQKPGMVGNMTVGAQLCAYVCKVSCGCREIGKWSYITEGSSYLDEKKMIEPSLAFDLVLVHSPTAGIHSCLLGHMCLCLWLRDCNGIMCIVPQWSGWLPDCLNGVESLIGDAELGVCICFWLGCYICMSECVVKVCTVVL